MQTKLGVIGTGTMGEAVIKGVLEAKLFLPRQIWASNRDREKVERIRDEMGIHAAENNKEVAEKSHAIILSVKPVDIPKVLLEIKDSLNSEHILISIAAGISTGQIKKLVPDGVSVIRTMPNTPAKIRQGMTLVAKSDDKKGVHLAKEIFFGLGRVVEIDESLMNVGTAISGCGPAYLFEIIEGLIMAGVTEGLSRDVSAKLVCQTIRGSLELLEASHMHPAVLRDEVTSPGGMAAAGLAALTEGGLRTVLAKGVSVSAKQAKKLAAVIED